MQTKKTPSLVSSAIFLIGIVLYWGSNSTIVLGATETKPSSPSTIYLPLILNNFFVLSPPILIGPPDNAAQECHITLSWNAVPNATKYQVRFRGTDGGYYQSAVQSTLSLFVFETGTVQWQVRAGDDQNNWSDFSPSRTVTVLPGPFTQPPMPIAPAKSSTLQSGQPDFVWDWAKHCDGTIYGGTDIYRVQVDDQPDFGSPIWNSTAGGTSRKMVFVQYTDPETSFPVSYILPEGTYYWRVRGEDSGGFSAWSETRSFQSRKPYNDCPPLKSGPETYIITSIVDPGMPYPTQLDFSELAPVIGQTQTITLTTRVKSPTDLNQLPSPVQSVVGHHLTDYAISNPLTYTLVSGDGLNGQWKAHWAIPGEFCYNYGFKFEITNSVGTLPYFSPIR